MNFRSFLFRGGGGRSRGDNASPSQGQLGYLVTVPPVSRDRGGLPQPDQVHLDAEVLHQQLPGHSAHRVEGVVRVGVGGAW